MEPLFLVIDESSSSSFSSTSPSRSSVQNQSARGGGGDGKDVARRLRRMKRKLFLEALGQDYIAAMSAAAMMSLQTSSASLTVEGDDYYVGTSAVDTTTDTENNSFDRMARYHHYHGNTVGSGEKSLSSIALKG